MGRVYRFSVNQGWAEANESHPIYDDNFSLIGGFTVGELGRINCFVSGNGSPISLKISSGEPFYATPLLGKNGQIEKFILSEYKLNNESIQVNRAEES